jgi:hypothetical protein
MSSIHSTGFPCGAKNGATGSLSLVDCADCLRALLKEAKQIIDEDQNPSGCVRTRLIEDRDKALAERDEIAKRLAEETKGWLAHDHIVGEANIRLREEVERLQNKLNVDSQNFELECRKHQIDALNVHVEELEKVLVLVGERAVVDWDDQTVGDVDKAVKEPKKYRDWVCDMMKLAKDNAVLKELSDLDLEMLERSSKHLGKLPGESNDEAAERVVKELAKYKADLAEAAGELLLPLPDPGSDLAKVMAANSILRKELDDCRGNLICAETEVEVLKLKMKGQWPK